LQKIKLDKIKNSCYDALNSINKDYEKSFVKDCEEEKDPFAKRSES